MVDLGGFTYTYNHWFAAFYPPKSGSGIYPTSVRIATKGAAEFILALPRHEFAANLFWDNARKYVLMICRQSVIRNTRILI